jgi:hypothetical protein
MADPPEGHVESVHDGNIPLNSPTTGNRENNRAPAHVQWEQLQERLKEIEEARHQLEQELDEHERVIGHRRDGGRARRSPLRKPEDPRE